MSTHPAKGKALKLARSFAALMLMVAFVAQAIARLFWGLGENFVSQGGALLHLATLTAILAIGCWIAMVRNETLALLSASFWFGASHTVLFLLDVGLFAAPRFAGVPLTFPFLIDMGCGGWINWGCIHNYWQVAAGLFATFALFILTYSIASRPIRGLATAICGRMRTIPIRALLLGWSAIVMCGNVIFWHQWSSRDPLHGLFLTEYVKGPPGLSTNARALPERSLGSVDGIAGRPLVLIVVDSMRSDVAMSGSEYARSMPFLHSLQASGQLVSYGPVVTTCTLSYCGITSLLSSKYWGQLGRPPLTLSDELARYGYRSHYLMSGNHRRYFNMRTIYGPNVTTFIDEQDGASGSTANDLDLLPHLQALKLHDADRSFIYLHLMAAHALGSKKGVTADIGQLAASALTGRSDAKAKAAYQRQYRIGLSVADKIIERMFAELRRRHLLDRAFVVITADHGERLGENSRFGHGGAPDREVALVPLLVFDPLNKKYAHRVLSSTVDVAPTLIAAIGARQPRGWSGIAIQQHPGDRVVAIDSEESEGFVTDADGSLVLYRCDTSSGVTTKIALTGEDEKTAALDPRPSAKILRQTSMLPQRIDRGHCSFLQ
jgi:Sulfatase